MSPNAQDVPRPIMVHANQDPITQVVLSSTYIVLSPFSFHWIRINIINMDFALDDPLAHRTDLSVCPENYENLDRISIRRTEETRNHKSHQVHIKFLERFTLNDLAARPHPGRPHSPKMA